MRVPISWLREFVELPAEVSAREIADRLIAAGLEVEGVEEAGADVEGPLTVGRVLEFQDEPQKNGKTIRWCQVDVGAGSEPRGIVCGAHNFAQNDLVVVALPGVVLPGGFAITARKTYGHVSDGMICSERELGLGDDHAGIMVLGPDEGRPGDDAKALLHLREDVLDIAVTPDRGYTMSIRGVAREAATAFGVELKDPVRAQLDEFGDPYPVRLEDPGCPAFAVTSVSGFDPDTPSPRWLRRRIQLAGTRPLALSIDITNYVMYEIGQPIHGWDRAKLTGPIVVRAAQQGEKLVTLDSATRELAASDSFEGSDMVVTDDTGPVGLGGVMGGDSTELDSRTTDIVVEAAYWDPVRIARTSRRHKLSTEASKRFERGVDTQLQAYAAYRVAELLTQLGGGTIDSAALVGSVPGRETVRLAAGHAAQVAGYPISAEVAARRLRDVGCTVEAEGDLLALTPPSWRPDLTDPNDFAEEVIRLEGYDAVPSVLPVAPPGRGWTVSQRLRRRIGLALAGAGYVEVLAYPFTGTADYDRLGLPADDPLRRTVELANPLSDEQPGLRTTLLPGLLTAAQRNVGRGQTDLAIFESGPVFLPGADQPHAPRPSVDHRPSDDELAGLNAALPRQPRHLGVVLTGAWTPAGWWGDARPVSWADAVEAARLVARTAEVELAVRQGGRAPWHPGRCAELVVGTTVVGYAGELHPKVCQAFELPARTCAAELDLDAVIAAAPEVIPAPHFSTFPVAKEDVALVVPAEVPVTEVEAALREGAGELLESLRLFDVYTGSQIPDGTKSLAFSFRFRAPDRTLTDAELATAKQAAVDLAAQRFGATQRGA
ncbi:phenylalanine--tRNA ligase subunit beta [Flindersiella endophytica]